MKTAKEMYELAKNPKYDEKNVSEIIAAWQTAIEQRAKEGQLFIKRAELPKLRNGCTRFDEDEVHNRLVKAGYWFDTGLLRWDAPPDESYGR